MQQRVWMFHVNPDRRLISREGLANALEQPVVGGWRISAGFRVAKPGELLLIMLGGRRAEGIIALAAIDRVKLSGGAWRMWFRPYGRASRILEQAPIAPEWVRANLKRQEKSLVDVSAGQAGLDYELQTKGILITERMFLPPRIRVHRRLPDAKLVAGAYDTHLSPEGRSRLVHHLTYERSRRNRDIVLRSRGGPPYVCDVCSFSFSATFGTSFGDFIEVHHRKPVSAGVRKPRPEDFLLLCSNCHAVAHWKCDGRPRGVRELKRLRARLRRSS